MVVALNCSILLSRAASVEASVCHSTSSSASIPSSSPSSSLSSSSPLDSTFFSITKLLHFHHNLLFKLLQLQKNHHFINFMAFKAS
ncbi:hypothetical protein M758_5G162000 [Ceratodon purpureus]|nr:hypothetical protein M758_5G162000 [Ceratodon purpureus]